MASRLLQPGNIHHGFNHTIMSGRSLRVRSRHPFFNHPLPPTLSSSSSDEDDDYTPELDESHISDTDSTSTGDESSKWVCFPHVSNYVPSLHVVIHHV